MTQRACVVLLGFGGSIAAHLCLFGLLASVDWSATPAWFGNAARTDPATAGQAHRFPADAASVEPRAQSEDGASVADHVVKPLVQRVEWSAPHVAAHVWDSTLVAALVGLLTLLLRRSGAHVRYWLWLGASMKFFLPYAALVGLGRSVAWLLPAHVVRGDALTGAIEFVRWPAAVSAAVPRLAPPVAVSTVDWLVFGVVSGWLLGAIGIASMRYRMWRRVRAALRVSSPLTLPDVDLPADVQLRSGTALLEPGVIGWRRPVLLLPAGIESRLTAPELQAVIAHEVSHIRRRDNFTAALHMLTETVFWFHPVAWWIGGRLVAERERACDEAVIAMGNQPATYARAIVKTCAMCAASPIACVAGVTGSDLAARLEAIVRNESPLPVSAWKKTALAATITGVLATPLGYGILRAAPRTGAAGPDATALTLAAGAPTFDAAVVKVNNSGLDQAFDRVEPGGRYVATNMALAVLVRFAYAPPRSRSLEPFEISGGPDWLLSDRFDIDATAGREVSLTELRAMLRTLLAERFQLEAHVERRQGAMYRLTLARPGRLGPHLRPAKADCAAVPFDPLRGFVPGEKPTCGYFGPSPDAPIDSNRAYQAIRGMTMTEFAGEIYPHLGRRVIDGTGLSGHFDGEFEFTANIMLPPPPSGVNPFEGRTLPSIFAVLPQQLGLELVSGRGVVDILVIDHAERPTPN